MASETPSNIDGWSALRLVLASVGGVVAGHAGMNIDGNELQALAGALVSIGSIAWGIYVRWGARSVPNEVAVRPDIPVQSSLTGQVTTGPGA